LFQKSVLKNFIKSFNIPNHKDIVKLVTKVGNSGCEANFPRKDKYIAEDANGAEFISLLAKFLNWENYTREVKNDLDMTQSDLTKDNFSFVSSEELVIKKKIEKVGTPLKEWDIKINYRIKTGFNEAFIIDGAKKDELIAKDRKSAEIIKPLLRGRNLQQYISSKSNEFLIVSHNNPPVDINEYLAIEKHLNNYYKKLEKRGDKGKTPYNLRNCAYLKNFSNEKILYPEFSSSSLFSFDKNQSYLLDTSWFIDKGDKFLLACLNSKAIWYYLGFITSSLGNASLRLKKVFMEKLPIPNIQKSYIEYDKNINHLINLSDKMRYKRDVKFAITAIDNKELYITEFLFAKQRGYVDKYLGHTDLNLNFYKTIPYMEKYICMLLKNSDDGRFVYGVNLDNKRTLLIVLDDDLIVSIFIQNNKKLQKQIKNGRFTKIEKIQFGETANPLILDCPAGSCSKAFWRQTESLELLYQKLNSKSISQEPFIALVDIIMNSKEKITKFKKHFESLSAVGKIEIKEEIEKLESLVKESTTKIDSLVYELYGLSVNEINIVEDIK